jgi:hypothetical protein
MNGGLPGIASTIMFFPESNSAVIALCNLRKPQVYNIARTAARIAFCARQPETEPEPEEGQ